MFKILIVYFFCHYLCFNYNYYHIINKLRDYKPAQVQTRPRNFFTNTGKPGGFKSDVTVDYFCRLGLDRSAFDNKLVSFDEHIKTQHNMWHYLYFIVLLKVKDQTEFTGPESYVSQMIKVLSVSLLYI